MNPKTLTDFVRRGRKAQAAVDQLTTAAQQLGRLGGLAGTDAQNVARRQNAQRAGRPRRVCVYCGEPVLGGHVDRRRDSSCGAHGWRWQHHTADARPTAPADPALLTDLQAYLERLPRRGAHRRLLTRLRALTAALA